ncbi:armadillo-type protein [Protomyces lactucae-debilis]|uniref:Armadillo-type protein n=1 Tax=Protomyces lactucae-debilis TaxID=2754530 RepID=A0A1Y2F2Q2_PROLT|nr:armadillo-type protein [Protomyces lactucae-debilis]ORY78123.1 armadillo-type protein [Protomyces lactucae-debilis]
MGRAKGRKGKVERHNPIAAADAPPRVHAARKAAAKPYLAKLTSTDAKERAESVSAIGAMLLEDKDFRKLLIKEDAIRSLLDRLSDDVLDVRVEASGALRNLCLDDDAGYDMCTMLYKMNILTLLSKRLADMDGILSVDTTSTGKLNMRLYENIVALLLAFAETSDTIINGINQELNLVEYLPRMMTRPMPRSARVLSAQCLMTLTDDNVFAVSRIVSDAAILAILFKLIHDEDLAIATLVCATLQNVADQGTIPSLVASPASIQEIILKTYSKAIAAADWERILDLEADRQSALLVIVETALEGLAKLATPDDGEDDEMRMDVDSQVDEALMKHLVSLVKPISRLATPLEGATGPGYPEKLQSVHLLALDALHNLAWTIVSAPDEANLAVAWHSQAGDLWQWASAALPRWLQLGEEMADSAFSLLYGIAKSLRGLVPATLQDVNSLIKLYNATLNAAVQTKIVGLVGCLGQAQGKIDVNKAVGTFLVTLVASYPRSDAECVLEALDALFDIYADAAFDYDEPVFVQGDFCTHLERCVPRVKQLKASLNKQRAPDLWHKADETMDNLLGFIDYKRSERA